MDGYRVEIIKTIDAWEKISEDWNEVLRDSMSDTIFLTYEWLSSWTGVFLGGPRKLFILGVYERDNLIGVAPWYMEATKINGLLLKKIGCLGMPEAAGDYFDVFAKRGQERVVADCIYDFLTKRIPKQWDILALRDQKGSSFFLLFFEERLNEDGKYAELVKGEYCPVSILRESWDKCHAGLSAHKKSRLRRYLRNLEKQGQVRHECYTQKAVQTGIEIFASFYEEKKAEKDNRFLIFLQKFTSLILGKDWIQIDILFSNGKAIAGIYHLKYNQQIFQYSMVTDKLFNTKVSVGNVLLGLCVDKAAEQGNKAYDFLKGAEKYKFSWANTGNSSLCLYFYSKTGKGIFPIIEKFVKAAGKILLR